MSDGATYESVDLEIDYPIALLRLNRPEKLNAFNEQLRAEVCDALARISADVDVRVVVLHGAGRAFSVGYDLDNVDRAEPSLGGAYSWKRTLDNSIASYWRSFWDFEKPIIAAVHGYCLGGACEIAMLCDLTISSEDCRFGEPEIRLGAGSTLLMPWYLPPKLTKELLLTGRMVTARRAYEVGLVNEVVPLEQLLECAKDYAQLIAKNDPTAIQLTKEGLKHTYELMGMLDALRYHDNLLAVLYASGTPGRQDFHALAARLGLRAALSKRGREFKELEERLWGT